MVSIELKIGYTGEHYVNHQTGLRLIGPYYHIDPYYNMGEVRDYTEWVTIKLTSDEWRSIKKNSSDFDSCVAKMWEKGTNMKEKEYKKDCATIDFLFTLD